MESIVKNIIVKSLMTTTQTMNKARQVIAEPFSQSKEISSDLCCFCGSDVSHNEGIMHSFQSLLLSYY